jgi:hypothetical protein
VPRDLRGETHDLGEQFGDLLFVFGGGDEMAVGAFEQPGHPFKDGLLPEAKLIGVDFVFGGELRDGLLARQHFLNDLGFESGSIVFSHGGHGSTLN